MTKEKICINKSTLGWSTTTPNHWSAFASDLGLAAGEWPVSIDVTPPIGNGFSFGHRSPQMNKDELMAYEYFQSGTNFKLSIFND